MLLLVTLCFFLFAFIQSTHGQCDQPCILPPSYTMSNKISQSLLDDINFYFPEQTSPPQPFISDSYSVPTITYLQEGPLKVAFVFEGAGYRNVLGYFTHDIGPNGEITNVVEHVLFPDINQANGCLQAGMQVEIPVIPAGTNVGFWIQANGRCNGNAPKYYSLQVLNPNQKRHLGAYIDFAREVIILGFEDVPTGDEDYNDAMFIFDTVGALLDTDNIAIGCVNTHCLNGGQCNYNTGNCECPPRWAGNAKCSACGCRDNDLCTEDVCYGEPCVLDHHADTCDTSNTWSCQNPPIPGCVATTGVVTTGEATTGVATTGVATSGVATTGVATTATAVSSGGTGTTVTSSTSSVETQTSGDTNNPTPTSVATTGDTSTRTYTDPNCIGCVSPTTGAVSQTGDTDVESGAAVIASAVMYVAACTFAFLMAL